MKFKPRLKFRQNLVLLPGRPDPGRVAEHGVKPAVHVNVGKVGRKSERERSTISQRTPRPAKAIAPVIPAGPPPTINARFT